MNKRHYEHTLPNIRGSLSNTYCDSYCFYLQWKQDKTVPFPAENRTMIHDGISVVKDLSCSGILNICLTENNKDNGNHQL